MNTQCPHCKTKYEVPEVYANKQLKCKKCKQSFTAIPYEPIVKSKKPAVQKESQTSYSGWPFYINKNAQSRSSFWRPGIYLQVLGCLGIIASICFAFVYNDSLSLEKNLYSGLYSTTYVGARTFLIETLIFGIAFLGILLSLVLIGLGSIVKKLQKNKI